MRIGIFVLAAGRGAGGPETYEVQLVRALARVDTRNTYRLYCTTPGAISAIGVDAPNFSHRVLSPWSRLVAVTLSLPLALVRDRMDLFHATYTPPPFATRPYVFTHHDNSPFDYPEFYNPKVLARLAPLLRRGLARASHIISPSEFSTRRTTAKFPDTAHRISTSFYGVDKLFVPVERELARKSLKELHGIDEPYFFFAGKLQQSKNLPRLIEAYARLLKSLPGAPLLVLAGKRGVGDVDISGLVGQLGLQGKVRELGHVPESDLRALYGAARALVFPSLHEGFGFPVLEAMASNTPVLTSPVCSLPEVAGDAALMVDPYSVEDLASGMQRLATDNALVEDLVRRGRANLKRFDWDEHARSVVAIYEKVAAARS